MPPVGAAGVIVIAAAAEMNHNEGCGSFSGCTSWASYFLGPPVVLPPKSSIEQR